MNPIHHTTALSSGLLGPDGRPLPKRDIVVTDLPLIDPGALDGLPRDIEARLLGNDTIVLWHPESELHIDMPLLERDDIATGIYCFYAQRTTPCVSSVLAVAERTHFAK
jgi:hypothetical protein